MTVTAEKPGHRDADFGDRLRPRCFRRGETLLREGLPASRMFVLAEGTVKLSRRTSGGAQVVVDLLGAGEPIGLLAALSGLPAATTATVLDDCDGWELDRTDLQAVFGRRPDVAARLLAESAERVRSRQVRVIERQLADARARVAQVLLELAHRFGEHRRGAVSVEHGLSQTELAQLVGLNRSTVNRILAIFQTHGWLIVDRGSFAMRAADPAAVMALAARARI